MFLLETGRIQSDMTIESYLGNTRQLLSWLFDNENQLKELDRILMMKYLNYLQEKQCQPNTCNTKINRWVNFNHYLKNQKVIERDAVFGKDKIQLSGNREVEVYSDKEMEMIEDYLENDSLSQRDRLIIKVLKETGIRVSEMINLRLENIDFIGLEIEVCGKGNKQRVLPIKSSLAEDVRKYISGEQKVNKHSSSPCLFVSERSGKLHRNTVLDITK